MSTSVLTVSLSDSLAASVPKLDTSGTNAFSVSKTRRAFGATSMGQ